MKPIFRYGLFAVALFAAAYAGYYFAEHKGEAEHAVVNNADSSDAKEDSTVDSQTSASVKSNQPVTQTTVNKFYKVYPKNTVNPSDDSKDNPATIEQYKPVLANEAHPEAVKTNADNNQEQGDSYIVPVSSTASAVDIINSLAELPNTIDGKPLGIHKIENKILIVVFWASWSAPCRYQLRDIDELVKKINNPNLEMVAVSVEENAEDAQRFMVKTMANVNFSSVSDAKNILTEQVKLDAIPTMLIINPYAKSSITMYKGYESGNIKQYEQQLRSLLGIAAQPTAQANE